MDPYLRRVYFSVAGVLIFLWLAMFAWVVKSSLPQALSFASAPLSESGEGFTPALKSPGIQITIYHPISGDTFSSLALKFSLSEAALRSLNQCNDGRVLKTDSPLFIPSKDGIYHIVKKGQGLGDIAKAYGISLKAVLKANEKYGDSDLAPEEVLFLPGAVYLTRQDPRWITLASLEVKKGFLKPTTGRFADHPQINFSRGIGFGAGLAGKGRRLSGWESRLRWIKSGIWPVDCVGSRGWLDLLLCPPGRDISEATARSETRGLHWESGKDGAGHRAPSSF
jgi:LysM repeat protein